MHPDLLAVEALFDALFIKWSAGEMTPDEVSDALADAVLRDGYGCDWALTVERRWVRRDPFTGVVEFADPLDFTPDVQEWFDPNAVPPLARTVTEQPQVAMQASDSHVARKVIVGVVGVSVLVLAGLLVTSKVASDALQGRARYDALVTTMKSVDHEASALAAAESNLAGDKAVAASLTMAATTTPEDPYGGPWQLAASTVVMVSPGMFEFTGSTVTGCYKPAFAGVGAVSPESSFLEGPCQAAASTGASPTAETAEEPKTYHDAVVQAQVTALKSVDAVATSLSAAEGKPLRRKYVEQTFSDTFDSFSGGSLPARVRDQWVKKATTSKGDVDTVTVTLVKKGMYEFSGFGMFLCYQPKAGAVGETSPDSAFTVGPCQYK